MYDDFIKLTGETISVFDPYEGDQSLSFPLREGEYDVHVANFASGAMAVLVNNAEGIHPGAINQRSFSKAGVIPAESTSLALSTKGKRIAASELDAIFEGKEGLELENLNNESLYIIPSGIVIHYYNPVEVEVFQSGSSLLFILGDISFRKAATALEIGRDELLKK